MLHRVASVFILVTCCASPARPQQPALSDFPPHDYTIVTTLGSDGGRALADALRTQAPSAAALSVLLRHRYLDESLAALSRIVDADGSELLTALNAATQTTVWWQDQRRRNDINAALGRIVERATSAAARRPRDQAAEIARQVLRIQANISRVDNKGWAAALREFIGSYDGTPAALAAQVEVLENTGTIPEQIDAAERFAREHQGTIAGARALYFAGFQLAVNYAINALEPRGSDPTDRLLRVTAIARELEDGRYPPCEWVARAPTLVTGFFVADSPPPSYGPGKVQRSLDEYAGFVRSHLTWLDPYPMSDALAHLISFQMWKLWKLQADPVAGAERFFDELASEPAAREAARFLEARTYLNRLREEPTSVSHRSKVTSLLSDLAANATERVRRQAHAMLAAELFSDGDDQRACPEFRRFVAAYPRSDWAWVASLRIGQCEESQNHWNAAADAYRRAAAAHADKPVAVLLGHAYAAQALEGTSNLTEAVTEYRHAIASWFDKDGSSFGLWIWRRVPAVSPIWGRTATQVGKPALELRLAQVRDAIAVPGGVLLERARWHLSHASRDDARTTAEQLIAQIPRSPLVRDARFVAHAAAYEDALDLANADSLQDVPAAMQRLEALSTEPYDVVVSLAKIARASIMSVQATPGADQLMKTALQDWLASQIALPPAVSGTLESDADAVRQTVFRPLGGGIYRSGWNAMEWPTTLATFLIAPATLPVQESNGRVTIVPASRTLPGLENTLYLTQQHVGLLEKTMAILGGSLRRVPANVMETPNQPAGASRTIMALWNTFFPMRGGHWGGWEFFTYPVITRIEFTNPARTKASVPVTIGYSGGTVLLEKIDGEWRLLEIVNRWIT